MVVPSSLGPAQSSDRAKLRHIIVAGRLTAMRAYPFYPSSLSHDLVVSIQYTPVDSMATDVTPTSCSHFERVWRSVVKL
jgi:hypothetical protein